MFKSIQSESMIKKKHVISNRLTSTFHCQQNPQGLEKKQNIENRDLDQIPNHQKGCMMYTIFFTQADQRMFHSSLHSSRQFFDGTRQALFPALAFFSRNFLKISMTFWI